MNIKEMRKRTDFFMHDMQYNLFSGFAKMMTLALEKTENERKQKDQLSQKVKDIIQRYDEGEGGPSRKRCSEPGD